MKIILILLVVILLIQIIGVFNSPDRGITERELQLELDLQRLTIEQQNYEKQDSIKRSRIIQLESSLDTIIVHSDRKYRDSLRTVIFGH